MICKIIQMYMKFAFCVVHDFNRNYSNPARYNVKLKIRFKKFWHPVSSKRPFYVPVWGQL